MRLLLKLLISITFVIVLVGGYQSIEKATNTVNLVSGEGHIGDPKVTPPNS